jgi:hypothetical protein
MNVGFHFAPRVASPALTVTRDIVIRDGSRRYRPFRRGLRRPVVLAKRQLCAILQCKTTLGQIRIIKVRAEKSYNFNDLSEIAGPFTRRFATRRKVTVGYKTAEIGPVATRDP